LNLSEHPVTALEFKMRLKPLLKREHRENGLVLFPIRIDEVVMQTDKA
jgi:hypothetical protein